MKSLSSPRRIWLLEGALLAWVAVVLVRLFCLQVVDYGGLERRAQRQQSRTLVLDAPRGVIYDRNFHPLAMSLDVDSVFAVPSQLANEAAAARALARALHLDERDLAGRLAAARNFCWVARKITAEQSRRVHALHLRGVYFEKESARFYPKGQLAAQVLGYVGMDDKGLGGLELEFDRQLRGTPGRELVQVDARGDAYNQVERPGTAGENLVLTLDQNIEFIAQQELDRAVAQTHAIRGTAIVEDPSTGGILAIADSPTFNPNDYRTTPQAEMTDAAVSDVYEPGSVFKLVTLSAALDQHLATPNEMVNCQEGAIVVGGRVIHDHARYGMLSVTDILAHSSDVGAIKLGLRLGDQRFYDYIRAYGFGRPTGIALPGESWGLARPPSRWTKMSIGAISMGQEIAVTPMQIIAMVSTLADGGIYHAPRIVLDKFRGARPKPDELTLASAAEGRRVVSAETAAEMKAMMAAVVLEGTGRQARLDGYTDGGKTGTAQKVDPGGHGYSKNHYVVSFAGLAPLGAPAVTILVALDSPVRAYAGEEVAAPVFRAIAERVLPYLGVPRDVPAPPGVEVAAATGAAAGAGAGPAFAAASAAVMAANAAAASPSASTATNTVVLDYDGGIKLPDFTGQSVRKVASRLEELGLDPDLEGDGAALRQTPPPGAAVAPGTAVTVWFGG